MPELNGLEVCNIIKSINPEQKIILCTANFTNIDFSKFDSVLKKPFTMRQTLEIINNVLQDSVKIPENLQ